MVEVNPESVIRARPFMCKAIVENHVSNLQRIFKANYPVNEPISSECGITPLMHCCAMGKTDCLIEIIEQGADFTLRDRAGRTALHYCCKGGSQENLKLLLEKMPKDIF